MLTPDQAMRQAHETAREYAIYGIRAYKDLFDVGLDHDPKAAATFIAGFMQAASTDFIGWAIQNQIEELRGTFNIIAEECIDVAVSFREKER